jgi:hypothetical protein
MSGRHGGLPALLAVLAVLAVAAPAAIAPVAASSPPQSVCPVCGPNFDRAVYDANVNLTDGDWSDAGHVGESTVRMTVSESGDAAFTARVELSRSVARTLRENESARDALLDAAFDQDYHVLGLERAERGSATVADDALVVDWTVPDVARDGPGGTLLVTMFGQSRSGITLHADHLSLAGPAGWNVTNHPGTGEVEVSDPGSADGAGERVVWSGTVDYESDQHLESGTYVAFGPTDGVVARANAELAVAFAIGPTMLSDALAAGTPAGVVLAIALAGCLFGLGGSPNPRRASRWLAIASGFVVVAGAVVVLVEGHGALATRSFELLAVPAGIGAFGWLTTRTPAVANLREAAWRVTGTVGVGGAVAFALTAPFTRMYVATVTVGVAGFYLVGVYDQRVGWPVAAVSAAVLATPILGVLPATPFGGFGGGVFALFLFALSIPTAVVGVVVYRIGAGKRVAGDRVVDQRTTA